MKAGETEQRGSLRKYTEQEVKKNRETGREGRHGDNFTKTNRVNTAERERYTRRELNLWKPSEEIPFKIKQEERQFEV